ncbi:MAG: hypothetical protein JJK57_12970 [Komagataeibacter hansenii]|nr:hypothetical protein [Novacetimonas hansenii]
MITEYDKNDLLKLKEKLKSSEEVTLFKIYYKDYLNQFIRLTDDEKTGDKGGKIRGALSGTCRKYRHFIIKELTDYIISFLPIFSFSVIQHI